MLPFFRKIRWHLAANNQFLKYSRYAIGEIVLVVIGILIALQINNWNEERKDQVKKQVYVEALISDLVKDTTEIGLFIREIDDINPMWIEFKSQIERPDATIDTLINLFSNKRNFYPILMPQNQSALNSLHATGDLELFEKNQLKQVLDFYEETKFNYHYIQNWYETVADYHNVFWQDYGWLTKKETNIFIYKISRQNLDEAKFSRELDVYVNYKSFWLSIMKRRAKALKQETYGMLEVLSSM